MARKRCSICGKSKPIEEFHWHNKSRGWRGSRCKPCDRERARNTMRKTRYGINPEQYAEMMERAGGTCEVCDGDPHKGRSLSIDHCHKTGKVRGLLCDRCNLILGYAKDQIALLGELASYLKRTRAR